MSAPNQVLTTATEQWLYPVSGMHVHKGILMMPDSTPSVLQWFENELVFEEGDVLLTSCAAAGIRWLQEVTWHMHHLHALDFEKKDTLGKRVPHADHEFLGHVEPRELFDEEEPPRVYKTHFPARLMGRHLDGKAKVIYWSTDPRCCLVKFHRMYNTLGKYLNFPDIAWDEFFRLFKEKQLFEGDWFETTKSFLPHIGKENFLFLQFEDAAKDQLGTVRKISAFLGISLSKETEERLAKVVPFDQTPGWANLFTEQQLKYYNQVYENEMKGTILEKKYM